MSADEFLAIKEIAVLVMALAGLLVYATLMPNWLVVAALVTLNAGRPWDAPVRFPRAISWAALVLATVWLVQRVVPLLGR